MKLTELNKKCLINMPILLEAITSTITKLEENLSPINKRLIHKIERELSDNSSRYILDLDEADDGEIYPFTNEEGTTFYPEMEIRYEIPIYASFRKKEYKYFIQWGYWGIYEGNCIYFQVFDDDDYPIINEKFHQTVTENILNKWQIVNEERSLLIKCEIDETLTMDIIDECATDFFEQVVKLFINNLPVLK